MKVGAAILFQEPSCDTRRLRRSNVIESADDRIRIRFEGPPLALEQDSEALAYFHGKREFMQQVMRIAEVGEDEEGTFFVCEPQGDAISAESRQHYRVTTISADIEACVGEERDLSVQDVSSTGFAVLAGAKYPLGRVLDVALRHADESLSGVASVQSIRELGRARVRYGLRAIAEDPSTATFLEGLQRISLAVQRDQLRRNSGLG